MVPVLAMKPNRQEVDSLHVFITHLDPGWAGVTARN